MTEDAPVKRKRGRPRKVVEAAPPVVKQPMPTRDPARGKSQLNPRDIAGYSTADMNYQFRVVRRVETPDAPTWIWGSTKGNSEIDMIVEESECVLLQACV
jgi:hypothetical protein